MSAPWLPYQRVDCRASVRWRARASGMDRYRCICRHNPVCRIGRVHGRKTAPTCQRTDLHHIACHDGNIGGPREPDHKWGSNLQLSELVLRHWVRPLLGHPCACVSSCNRLRNYVHHRELHRSGALNLFRWRKHGGRTSFRHQRLAHQNHLPDVDQRFCGDRWHHLLVSCQCRQSDHCARIGTGSDLGPIWGAFIGVLFLGVLLNAMTLWGFNPYVQQVITGGLILAAVFINFFIDER